MCRVGGFLKSATVQNPVFTFVFFVKALSNQFFSYSYAVRLIRKLKVSTKSYKRIQINEIDGVLSASTVKWFYLSNSIYLLKIFVQLLKQHHLTLDTGGTLSI